MDMSICPLLISDSCRKWSLPLLSSHTDAQNCSGPPPRLRAPGYRTEAQVLHHMHALAKRLDRGLIQLKNKLFDTLPEEDQPLVEWEFGTGANCSPQALSKAWSEYADLAGVREDELSRIVSLQGVFSTPPPTQTSNTRCISLCASALFSWP